MKVKAIPEGFHSITPDLAVNDVEAAIEFYRNALGAKKRKVFHGPGGSIVHAELLIDNSILMLSPENPEHNIFSPLSSGGGVSATMFLYVENVDSTYEKAVSAGATVTMPVADMFWGDRAGAIVDPFGHRWMLATHTKDLSDKEIEKAAMEMFARP